jgi:hypothetical protein
VAHLACLAQACGMAERDAVVKEAEAGH